MRETSREDGCSLIHAIHNICVRGPYRSGKRLSSIYERPSTLRFAWTFQPPIYSTFYPTLSIEMLEQVAVLFEKAPL